MTPPTTQRGRGRPRSIPDGTTNRGFRITDAEWKQLKAYLAKLRKHQRPGLNRGG